MDNSATGELYVIVCPRCNTVGYVEYGGSDDITVRWKSIAPRRIADGSMSNEWIDYAVSMAEVFHPQFGCGYCPSVRKP